MSKVKMNGVRLYFRYIRMNILSQTEYKGWWLSILQTFLTVITDPISTILMFSRFGSIGEWTMPRILLMYAMAVTSFGLAECTARGFDSFPAVAQAQAPDPAGGGLHVSSAPAGPGVFRAHRHFLVPGSVGGGLYPA